MRKKWLKLYCDVIQWISFLDIYLINICVHSELYQMALKLLVGATMCTVSSERYGRNAEALVSHNPPGGSKWIISVGDQVDNSFTALGSSDPRQVRLELKLGFCFLFSICSIPFCLLLNVIHDTFSMSYEILP